MRPLNTVIGTQNLPANGLVQIFQYDNDGMGSTGEVVVELQLPVNSITVD
jgi:hypothetical protein